MDLEIVEYREVTIAESVVTEPVYNQPVVTIGTGDSFEVLSHSEYEIKVQVEPVIPVLDAEVQE